MAALGARHGCSSAGEGVALAAVCTAPWRAANTRAPPRSTFVPRPRPLSQPPQTPTWSAARPAARSPARPRVPAYLPPPDLKEEGGGSACTHVGVGMGVARALSMLRQHHKPWRAGSHGTTLCEKPTAAQEREAQAAAAMPPAGGRAAPLTACASPVCPRPRPWGPLPPPPMPPPANGQRGSSRLQARWGEVRCSEAKQGEARRGWDEATQSQDCG
jgi:hypothetical protein